MKKSERIQSVKTLATSREREAVSAMGMAQQEVTIRQARLEELKNYQLEYYEKSRNMHTGSVSSQQLQVFNEFLAKLKLAIKEQTTLVEIANGVLNEKRQSWLVTRQRVQVYDNVVRRLEHNEQKAENKIQQKSDDEVAARLSQNRAESS